LNFPEAARFLKKHCLTWNTAWGFEKVRSAPVFPLMVCHFQNKASKFTE